MVFLCKKSWECQTFSLIYNISYNKYNTVWTIAFIVPNYLVWAYKSERNFCWYWKVKLIFQYVFPPLFLLPEWMQSPCFAWLQQEYSRDAVLGGWICTAGQPQAAQCLLILLLSLFPSSICSHHRCTDSACPPQCSCLSPCLCTHGSFQRESWNTEGWYATHLFSRDTAVGGMFVLWISPILGFVLQNIFSEVLQLR